MICLWCEGVKDRVYLKFGFVKLLLKKMKFFGGLLVSYGEFVVDGFMKSFMIGKFWVDIKDKDKKKVLEMFYEVYGLKKEDLEVYFRNMGVLENFKSLKFRRNIKWGNVFDKLELIVFFIKGLIGYLEYSESELLEKEVKVVLCVLKFLVLK